MIVVDYVVFLIRNVTAYGKRKSKNGSDPFKVKHTNETHEHVVYHCVSSKEKVVSTICSQLMGNAN